MAAELHLSIPILQDAVQKIQLLDPAQWEHVHRCERCLLLLADLTRIQIEVENLRGKVLGIHMTD